MDEKTIKRLLPNTEKPRVGMYRRLVCFSGNRRICKDDDDNWAQRQGPPQGEATHQFVPLH